MAKRKLTTKEKRLLSTVFVNTLPFDRIQITDKIGLGDRAYALPVLIGKKVNLNVGEDNFNSDLSEVHPSLLIHESVHAWQSVHGFFKFDYALNSGICQLINVFNPNSSAYDYRPGRKWKDYNAEQQAQIIEHWYRDGLSIKSSLWHYIRDHLREPGFGGKVYFFGDDQYIRWTIGHGKDRGYPKNYDTNWNTFIKESNAAFNRMHGEKEFYYFFNGDEYLKWERGKGALSGYPKKIADNWNSDFIKDGFDSVLSTDNNKLYFFKGDEYTRHTIGVGQDPGYPKKIASSWDSDFIKDGFDFCFYNYNGKAYFFKGEQYIRHTIGVGQDKGYPKLISDTWKDSFLKTKTNFALIKRNQIF